MEKTPTPAPSPSPPPPGSSPSLIPPSVADPTRRMRVGFAILFALALGLSLYLIWPFRAPLLVAAVLASVLQAPFRRLVHLLGGRRTLAGISATVGLVVVLVGPLAAVIAFAIGQVVKGLGFVRDELGIENVAQLRHGELTPRGQELVDRVLSAFHLSRGQLGDLAHRASAEAEETLSRVVESSSRATFHTAIMVVAFYFFLVEGSRIIDWLRRVSPLEARHTGDLIGEFRAVSRASILGNAIAASFQALTATLGFIITGVPHPVFFGLLTLLASFVPIVGTLLVWLPAVLFLWFGGHHGAAIGLTIWCLVLVVGTEHIGKPLVMRAVLGGQQEMHTGLLFLALLGGLEMFGLIGLILGPMVFAFLLAMLRIYERDFVRVASRAPPRA
jgi:predicted PurR-regulated permease PerM